MTTYNGTNMELEQDASGNWVFTNPAQTFIDTNSFPTADPQFQYAPTDTTPPEDETTDPCPAGYIYDETLKQCVPDPNYQAPGFLGEPQDGGQDRPEVKIAGTNRTTTDNNFMASDAEYAAMTPQELIENYKQRGLVGKDENDNIVINLSKQVGAMLIDAALAKIGQGGEADARQKKDFSRLLEKGLIHSKDNKGNYINTGLLNFMPHKTLTAENFPMTLLNQGENYKITIPTTRTDKIITNTDTGFTPGWGNLTYDMGVHVVDPITKKYELTPNSWENYMNEMAKVKTSVTKPVTQVTQEPIISEDKIAKEKERKAKLEADAAQVELDRKKVEAERDMQETIRKAEKQEPVKKEYRDKGQVTYSTKDTGGYVTTKNIPSAPPRERGGGGYTKPTPKKHERPGTSGAPGYHW
jgi:hypothetical protein